MKKRARYRILEHDGMYLPQRRGWLFWESLSVSYPGAGGGSVDDWGSRDRAERDIQRDRAQRRKAAQPTRVVEEMEE